MEGSGKRDMNEGTNGSFKSYEKEEKERIEKARGKRKKRIRRRRVFSFLFIVLLILCVGIIFIRTPLFDVETIIIEGNSLVSDEEILATVKISEGENIFSHSVKYMETELMSVPYISKAEVKKKLPSELRIKVYEENEFAVLDFSDGKISCDKNGKTIRLLAVGEYEGLVSVGGCEKGEFSVGEYVKLSDEETTEMFYRCLSAVRDYGLINVTDIDMSDIYDVVIKMSPGLIIKLGELGNEDELSYKMAYIREVMNNLPQNISGIIDATNIEAGVSYRTGEFEYDTSEEEQTDELAQESEAEQEKTEE